MSEPNNEEDNFLISLSDCLRILKKGRSKIVVGTLCFSALMVLYAVTRPIQYETEATFREKNNKQGSLGSSSLTSIIMGGISSGGQSEAITMMKSRKLLAQVIKPLSLQATLKKKGEGSSAAKNIYDNIVVEYYYLRNKKGHPLTDSKPAICPKNINYSGELPITLKLTFESETAFEVFGPHDEPLGSGKLGSPFTTHEFSFTITRMLDNPLNAETYLLTLSPLADIAKKLSKQIKIEPEKEDPSLLKLTYRDRGRHQAPKIVNQLMLTYQDYLRSEQRRISSEQNTYLHQRENEMGQNLKEMIETYANKVSEEVSKEGYADSEKAMNFLSSQIQDLWQKLFQIEIELKRHEKFLEGGDVNDTGYLSDQTPEVIKNLIDEIRKAKRQSDSIELALRDSSTENTESRQTIFSQQVSEQEKVRLYADEIQELLADLDKGIRPAPSIKLLGNEKFMIRAWQDKLMQHETSWKNASRIGRAGKNEEMNPFKGQYKAYLENLLHFLDMSEKTIQERLTHQQTPQLEFQGIDLETSKGLYVEYHKNLNTLQAKIRRIQFALDQLDDPEFEVSSLNVVMDLSLPKEILEKATEDVLALQDDINRSQKEKERLKNELQTQKKFIYLHLRQTAQLLHLDEGLLKDKILSLQKASLELLHQEASLLEKHLAKGLNDYVQNLKQDRQLVKQFQFDLRQEMAKLPLKWASEKLIEQQMHMNAKMIEELTKVVESKNIGDNLEMIQSAPVDLALPPTQPKRPNVILFAILGAVLGAFLSLGGLLAQLVTKGVTASRENLELAGVNVSGLITRDDEEQNLKTLRRLMAYLNPLKQGQTLAFLTGNGFDFSEDLATLMSKRGLKILLLDLAFDKQPKTLNEPGLFSFLEGGIAKPKIDHTPFFDRIRAGGMSSYANELISSDRFSELLKKLKPEYDWIIGVSNFSPASAEAENFLNIFDHALMNITSETLQDLHHLLHLAKTLPEERKISFIKQV